MSACVRNTLWLSKDPSSESCFTDNPVALDITDLLIFPWLTALLSRRFGYHSPADISMLDGAAIDIFEDTLLLMGI